VKQLALFVAVAVLAHVATVALLPTVINGVVVHRLAQRSGGYNRAVAWPRATADARLIVRPSPDMLYTSCAFDVSEHPLRITAPIQDSYVSISGFAANTDNFFALNDSKVAPGPDGRRQFDVVLAKPGASDLPAGARVITAPSDRGLILFRSLIPRDADLPRLQKEFQSQQRCEPL
jgi:uncharacterized membrane protein